MIDSAIYRLLVLVGILIRLNQVNKDCPSIFVCEYNLLQVTKILMIVIVQLTKSEFLLRPNMLFFNQGVN